MPSNTLHSRSNRSKSNTMRQSASASSSSPNTSRRAHRRAQGASRAAQRNPRRPAAEETVDAPPADQQSDGDEDIMPQELSESKQRHAQELQWRRRMHTMAPTLGLEEEGWETVEKPE